jgi:cytochrome c biogenesis protein CcmG, thiol:disulfide interchange protein DsbE
VTSARLAPRAEDEARTRDPQLGKLVLYQLSYFRVAVSLFRFQAGIRRFRDRQIASAVGHFRPDAPTQTTDIQAKTPRALGGRTLGRVNGKSIAAIAAVLAVVALLAFGVFSSSEVQLAVGDPVPAPELEVLAAEGDPEAGDTLSVRDFEGSWVLVNTWASWCGPCEEESPALADFHGEHAREGEFTVLGVQTQDGTAEGLDFVEEFGLNYPSIRDGSGDYADDLGATGVPDTLLVDPEGNIAYIRRGPVTPDILDSEILPLIEGDQGVDAANEPPGAS